MSKLTDKGQDDGVSYEKYLAARLLQDPVFEKKWNTFLANMFGHQAVLFLLEGDIASLKGKRAKLTEDVKQLTTTEEKLARRIDKMQVEIKKLEEKHKVLGVLDALVTS